MSRLEEAYIALQRLEVKTSRHTTIIDTRVLIVAAVIFLSAMLSVPVGALSMLVWYELIPIISAAWLGLSFTKIFLRSLYVLPFVLLIGIFNPIIDHTPAFEIGNVTVTVGWLTFFSILLRGLMGVQMLFILIESCGFNGFCRGLRRLYVPSFLTDQLLFVYRYLMVLMLEAISMQRARSARGFGRKNYPLKLWGTMIGQLFLRSVARSERVGMAMQARGFSGILPSYNSTVLTTRLHSESRRNNKNISSLLFLFLIGGGSIAMRFFNLSRVFSHF